jgi:hypothetical protein
MPALVTSRKTFAETRVEELLVMALNGALVTDDEWREHCENLRALNKIGGPAKAMIIFGIGEGPNAKQRQVLAEEYADLGKNMRVALLTDSVVARGVLTAIGWLLSSQTKAYGLRELNTALSALAAHAKFNAAQVRTALVEVIRLTGADPSALG